MKKIFIIVLAAFSCFAQQGFSQEKQEKKPIIKFDTKTYDFGVVKEELGKIEAVFNFTNVGNDTLKLLKVKASCGCTATKYTKEPVLPGKKGFVKAIYGTKNRPGKFRKGVVVTTNDLQNQRIVLVISGQVTPKIKTYKDWYPTKIGNLRFKTNHLAFTKIKNDEIKTDTLTIYNEWDKDMKILSFKNVLPFFTCKAEPEVIKPSKTGYIIIKYDATKRKNDYGLKFSRFTMVTNDELQPEKRMITSAEVVENFSKLTPEQLKNAPKIEFEKTVYDFGSVKTGEKVLYSFVFKNQGKTDLIIRKVKTSCGCTATNPEKTTLKPGESSKINISFNTRGRSGNQHKTITVICNDPNKSTTVLSVKGKVIK
jgi:hypothetical protein